MLTFNEAFDREMGHEGKYVNHPRDPGLETKWGISKRSYPHLNIKDLSRDDAKKIYYEDFWKPMFPEALTVKEDGWAFQLFDFAVNSGIETAVRHFQRIIGTADDGDFGYYSRAALNEFQNKWSEADIIKFILADRLDYMTRLKDWDVFGRGWARRIAQNLRYGARDS